MNRREAERRRCEGKQEVDQQDEALPFSNRLFLLHLAITSVNISLSAFWLIRSNDFSVRVCVCMCVNAVAMAIIFLYYHTNRTLATCHLSYTHVRLANVLLTIASSASFCLVAFAFLFMLNIKYTFSRCTIKTLMNLGRMKHACRSFKRFLIIRGS